MQAGGRGRDGPRPLHRAGVEREAIAPTTKPSPLKLRAAEMLALTVADRSNPEPAAALFIRRRTVTSDVANVFARL
ncbi:MAG: hypothetical protein AVDCRST_MAG19-1551 [uncultured Thermomicrobiales bacterium]|uniref:HTH luxR-type domain-containing protein n=1 Tax=uncultured Thermomicrobiales bacterium TaxID=1645740 RepID=A0A6J4U681_9BACT|nr:MAG: hypothetical protein AVDCRST_MAG19-1551 [uncultured Thermomicrobiales bacterium]